MQARTRILLGLLVTVAVVAGAVVGWLLALSRGASVSDAVVSAVLTGVFTLLGTAVGVVVPLLQNWEQNRPNLKLQLAYQCLHASPALRLASETLYTGTLRGISPAPMEPTFIRCKPDSESGALFVLLDVQVQNRSHLDDAITEITIVIPGKGGHSARLPVRIPDGSTFFGESIPAHALRHLRLRLMLDRANYADTVNWVPGPDVVWRLEARTINDQNLAEEIRPAGHFPAYVERIVAELDDWRS